jgi:hypothetical protein
MMYIAARRILLNLTAKVDVATLLGATAPSILEAAAIRIKVGTVALSQDGVTWALELFGLSEGSHPF